MKIVKTMSELEAAIKANERMIRAEGKIAEQIIKAKKRNKAATIGGAAAIAAGVVLAPFTGGASLMGAAAGTALTVGTITITATELAIICGFTMGMTALLKNYDKISINAKEGTVTLEKTK